MLAMSLRLHPRAMMRRQHARQTHPAGPFMAAGPTIAPSGDGAFSIHSCPILIASIWFMVSVWFIVSS